MSLLIGFLTFILVVTCLFLILLVLVQLPKKEAGAGLPPIIPEGPAIPPGNPPSGPVLRCTCRATSATGWSVRLGAGPAQHVAPGGDSAP